jgi:FlaA1/EpsC-like NDP-sugar epimerase
MMAAADTGNLAILWPAAGILVAFQTAVLTLRINREIDVSKQRDLTWLPLADWLNILSILATLLGVFAARVLSIESSTMAAQLFAVAALLLAGYPIALAGHYDLLNRRSTRSMQFCTLQEIVVISFAGCASVDLLIWARATPGLIAVLSLIFHLMAVYGWRFVARTYLAVREDREKEARMSRALSEIGQVLHEENSRFANRLIDVEHRYTALLDEIRSTAEEEVDRRKLLRMRKNKVFEELVEWAFDVRQI